MLILLSDMTVVDATNMLFDWYSENDSFELEKDFMRVIPVTDTPEEDRSAFLCALDGFEQNMFVFNLNCLSNSKK